MIIPLCPCENCIYVDECDGSCSMLETWEQELELLERIEE